MKKIKLYKRGFTIIEVLIVLAVASLILLIIFIAVPVLQRTSRNHERKVDAEAVVANVSDFTSNNSGISPNSMRTDTNADGTTNDNVLDLGYSAMCGNSASNYSTVAMAYYNVGGDPNWGQDAGPDSGGSANYGANISCNPVTSVQTPAVIAADNNAAIDLFDINTETISIVFGETCNKNMDGAGQLNSKSFAVFYVLETGSGNGSLKCVD